MWLCQHVLVMSSLPRAPCLLEQVTDGKLPKAFDYHKVPAPFIQVGPATCRGMSPSAFSDL